MTIREHLEQYNDIDVIDDIIDNMIIRVNDGTQPVEVLIDYGITDVECEQELINLCNE